MLDTRIKLSKNNQSLRLSLTSFYKMYMNSVNDGKLYKLLITHSYFRLFKICLSRGL